MKETRCICKVITPMFMTGADGRTPELRPSEFKGMMRFWWRAIKAEDKIDKLQKEEAKLFGGTGNGERKSKISIKVIYNSKELEEKFIGENIKNEFIKSKNYGLAYLFYSTFSLKARGEPVIRKYIKPDFPFQINFSSFDEKALKEALASFWLSVYLGGFGTRARRGGGNISIEKVEGNTFTIDFIPEGASTKGELWRWFVKNVNRVKETIPTGTLCRKYSNLKEAFVFILDCKPYWTEALNFIGNEYKSFREKKKSDVWRTPAFGMPVMHRRFRKFRERFVPYKGNRRLSERRSSPLIFKVIKAENLYFPIIVKLSGDIVYDGGIGREERQDKWSLISKRSIDDSILDEFLNSLKDKVEVKIE